MEPSNCNFTFLTYMNLTIKIPAPPTVRFLTVMATNSVGSASAGLIPENKLEGKCYHEPATALAIKGPLRA